MCTHARYYSTHNAHARYYTSHNAHAHRKLMGWAKQRRPRPELQASYVILSGFRAALDLDTYPLSNFIRPRCAERAKPSRGKPVLIIIYAYWLFRLFSRHISRTQSFQRNRHIVFLALVALKLLVSLKSRLVACSARIVADNLLCQ